MEKAFFAKCSRQICLDGGKTVGDYFVCLAVRDEIITQGEAMKLKYNISERSGTFGGRSFIVQTSVQLDAAEAHVRSSYGVYETIELGDKFKDTKGVDVVGHIHLSDLIGSPREYKFPTIQMAGGFIDQLVTGLQGVRGQILATQERVAALNKEVEIAIN